MSRVTMRQIAAEANVSPTTVAHTLNNTPGAVIAADTRARVLEVAKRLGYQRGLLASAIKEPLRHVGVAFGREGQPDETDIEQIFAGVRAELLTRNYFPVVQALPAAVGEADDPAAFNRMLDLFRQKLIDGYIVDKQCFTDVSIVRLYDAGVPLVLVNGKYSLRGADGQLLPAAVCDYRAGAALAVRHLVELGHRHIAMLTRPCMRYGAAFAPHLILQLREGFAAALKTAKLPANPGWVLEANPTNRDECRQRVLELLDLRPKPTAVVVADDAMAIVAMHALNGAGLRVPEDLSVVGFGGWPWAERLADPPLSTIRVPFRETGRCAARMVLDLIDRGQCEPRQIVLAPELCIRNSTARLRAP